MSINRNSENYDQITLKHLQRIQLMILKDFIEFCEKKDISYFAYGGTLLGAIRHHGFIPWDDDTDIIMMRSDYEKFVKEWELEKNSKYSLFTLNNTKDYFLYLSKFSLNETEFREDWTRNTKFQLGISLDIFIFDDVPDNKFKRSIYYGKIKLIKIFLDMIRLDFNKVYPSKLKKFIIIMNRYFMKLFRIDSDKFKKFYNNVVESNNNKGYSCVYENIAQTYTKSIPKEILFPIKKVTFEDIEINIPNDYDEFLTILYGDYMELPPVEDRKVHQHDYIDFGPY